MLARTVTPLPTKIGALAIGIGSESFPGVVKGPPVAGLGSTDVGGDCRIPGQARTNKKQLRMPSPDASSLFFFNPLFYFVCVHREFYRWAELDLGHPARLVPIDERTNVLEDHSIMAISDTSVIADRGALSSTTSISLAIPFVQFQLCKKIVRI